MLRLIGWWFASAKKAVQETALGVVWIARGIR
jgi:hypothetical protein